MSKKHLILPVVACLMLAGCTMGTKTKKKKKSSSVEVTSKVNPSSQGGTTVSPTSSPTTVAPTSAAPTSNPTSATPSPSSGTSVTPTTSTTIPPVPGGWNADEAKVFADNFHGIVPPYLSAGLDLTSEEVDDGYYGIWSNAITESAAETYYASVDDSWVEKTAGEGEEAYTYLYKDSTDGEGHAEISIYLDETDDSKFYIGFEWYDDGGDVPPVGSWTQCTTRPADGTGFIIGCNNGTADKFLDGTIVSNYYLGCSADADSAIRFTVATSGEGFTIQATSGSINGQYIEIYVNGTHVNARYSTSPYVFQWVVDENGKVANTFGGLHNDGSHGDQLYVLAQQPGKSTLAATYSGYWATNYIGRLYKQS